MNIWYVCHVFFYWLIRSCDFFWNSTMRKVVLTITLRSSKCRYKCLLLFLKIIDLPFLLITERKRKNLIQKKILKSLNHCLFLIGKIIQKAAFLYYSFIKLDILWKIYIVAVANQECNQIYFWNRIKFSELLCKIMLSWKYKKNRYFSIFRKFNKFHSDQK